MRTYRQRQEHQGKLNAKDVLLLLRMMKRPRRYFTSLEVCQLTGCVSARDKVRKLKTSGLAIGPANLLRTNEDGTRIYGWRIAP